MVRHQLQERRYYGYSASEFRLGPGLVRTFTSGSILYSGFVHTTSEPLTLLYGRHIDPFMSTIMTRLLGVCDHEFARPATPEQIRVSRFPVKTSLSIT